MLFKKISSDHTQALLWNFCLIFIIAKQCFNLKTANILGFMGRALVISIKKTWENKVFNIQYHWPSTPLHGRASPDGFSPVSGQNCIIWVPTCLSHPNLVLIGLLWISPIPSLRDPPLQSFYIEVMVSSKVLMLQQPFSSWCLAYLLGLQVPRFLTPMVILQPTLRLSE